jgi:hypothetical protein
MNSKQSWPAVLLVSRGPTAATPAPFCAIDNRVLHNSTDAALRWRDYQTAEELGGVHYTLTLAALAEAEAVKAEILAELSGEPEPAAVAMTEAEALTEAERLARAAFDGDKATLSRLDRAVAIVKDGGVKDLGGGQWAVSSQSNGGTYAVNGSCDCPDAHHNGREWCKHRLAVALTCKVKALQNGNGAKDAPTSSAPELAPEETNTHTDDSTIADDLQAWADYLEDQETRFAAMRGVL